LIRRRSRKHVLRFLENGCERNTIAVLAWHPTPADASVKSWLTVS